jgi:hypothetical protein
MFNKRQKDFVGAIKAVLETESGQKLFRYLKEDYVNQKSVANDTHLTYYNLGKKDLVQDLLLASDLKEEELQKVNIIQHYND